MGPPYARRERAVAYVCCACASREQADELLIGGFARGGLSELPSSQESAGAGPRTSGGVGMGWSAP